MIKYKSVDNLECLLYGKSVHERAAAATQLGKMACYALEKQQETSSTKERVPAMFQALSKSSGRSIESIVDALVDTMISAHREYMQGFFSPASSKPGDQEEDVISHFMTISTFTGIIYPQLGELALRSLGSMRRLLLDKHGSSFAVEELLAPMREQGIAAGPMLLEALDASYKSSYVNCGSLAGLASHDHALIPQIVKRLDSEHVFVAFGAQSVLERLGPLAAKVVPDLIEQQQTLIELALQMDELSDESEVFANYRIILLGAIAKERADIADWLIDLCDSTQYRKSVLGAVIRAIGTLRANEARCVPWLREQIDDYQEDDSDLDDYERIENSLRAFGASAPRRVSAKKRRTKKRKH